MNATHENALAEEILALEANLAAAEKGANAGALHHLVAPDYEGVNALGHRVDRDAFVGAFLSPDLLIESLQQSDVDVRVFNHVAVATGRMDVSGYTHNQRFHGRYHFTDVWARRIMVWELVAGHVSNAAGP